MAVIGTDDQLILPETERGAAALHRTRKPRPVLAKEFLRVIKFPVACDPIRCSSRAESPLAVVIKSGQHQLDEYQLTPNAVFAYTGLQRGAGADRVIK